MQGSKRVVTAAVYQHPADTNLRELRVFFEPESADDLLHSQVAHIGTGIIEEEAEALRRVLLEKGWLEMPPESLAVQ